MPTDACLIIWLVAMTTTVECFPIHHHHHRPMENSLETFLGEYYDHLRKIETSTESIYDRMQGDEPSIQNVKIDGNSTGGTNYTQSELDYFRTMRNRTKDHWIQTLKENILRQIGRTNMSTTLTNRRPDDLNGPINISALLPSLLNGSANANVNSNDDDEDLITEKIRSHYPSCEVPPNTEQEIVWRDDSAMNLYFNFDYSDPSDRTNIATAILRLYRIPSSHQNATKTTKNPDCPDDDGNNNNNGTSEEERLLRVSVYWYAKTLKKKRVKKLLSDSRVISDSAPWVELSVKPATKAWARGRNMGLSVIVEDQENNLLKADRYFKGIDCMVGSSTPKPIPTIVIDAARQTNELDRLAGLIGGNSTSHLHNHLPMLPSIDICTLEFPENYSEQRGQHQRQPNACNLRKLHEHGQLMADKEKLERLATLPDLLAPSARHIRHQRQHHQAAPSTGLSFDFRSSIVNQRVLTPEEVRSLNLSLPSRNR